MLVYPQLMMAASVAAAPSTDYPVLNSSNTIAQAVEWMAMPALYSKDTAQAEGTLFGSATRSASGLQVPNNVSGMMWPKPANLIANLEAAQAFSVVWSGKPSAFASWANFLAIQKGTGDWTLGGGEAFAFGRDASGTSGRCSLFNTAGSRTGYPSGSSYIATSTSALQYAATWDGSTLRFYKGSALFSSHLVALTWDIPATGNIAICNRSGASPGEGVTAADATLALLASRAYTAAELAEIRDSPASLLAATF